MLLLLLILLGVGVSGESESKPEALPAEPTRLLAEREKAVEEAILMAMENAPERRMAEKMSRVIALEKHARETLPPDRDDRVSKAIADAEWSENDTARSAARALAEPYCRQSSGQPTDSRRYFRKTNYQIFGVIELENK